MKKDHASLLRKVLRVCDALARRYPDGKGLSALEDVHEAVQEMLDGGDPQEVTREMERRTAEECVVAYDGSYVEDHCSECNERMSECTCDEEPES